MLDSEPWKTITKAGLEEKNALFSTILKQSANIRLSYRKTKKTITDS